MDKIEKINREFERLFADEAPKHNQQCDLSDRYFTEIPVMSNLLDTIESEEPDKSLEEEIDLWISENKNIHHGDKLMVSLLKDVASYFAEWGAEHAKKDDTPISDDIEEAADIYEAYYDVGEEHGYLYCLTGDIKNAFIAGAKWQIEHLKK